MPERGREFQLELSPNGLSPYRVFRRLEWAALRADTPMTLTAEQLESLRGLHEPFSLIEVEEIYLAIARVLRIYVSATTELFRDTKTFLRGDGAKTPYIIGMAGSVAAGKSTSARVLQALLARLPGHPKVDLITTDGFLFPNAILKERGLMERKGFPESYDAPALLQFLTDIKAGQETVTAPNYSHLVYDVVEGDRITIKHPDILIVEGLNVLQPARLPRDGRTVPFVSDFFDFSIYLDAPEPLVRKWYINRFMQLRETAFSDPRSFFHRYASLTDEEARETSLRIWETINLPNLEENILPTRQRADLILHKGQNHDIEAVALRKL